MRKGMKWFIVVLVLAVIGMMFGVPLFGLVFGPGFDP